MIVVNVADVLRTYKSKQAAELAIGPYRHLFPIKRNPELAGIVADLMGDGHLQGNPKWRFDFTSASTKELRRFEGVLHKVFNIGGKIRRCSTNKFGQTYNYGVNNKPISRILKLCGVPTGNKVEQSFSVPFWIVNDKECFRRFVQRLFDCEATVDCFTPAIEIQMYKQSNLLPDGFRFMNQIKFGLRKHFAIETTNPFTESRSNYKRKGLPTKAMRMKIKKRDSLERFYTYIGFENITKQSKLDKIVGRQRDGKLGD